jgi:pimeloyl-ACP methyl ester carboxylesterase
MPMPTPPIAWMPRLGRQRDWIWRGWQVRYTYQPSPQPALPMLFIHGFGSSLTQWHCNIQPLAAHHPVYALDMLGFGASRKAPAPYQVQLWVEQVYDFWRSLLQQPVLLVGHSLGALVALSAAAQHPEMVQGLVMMTVPPARSELIPPWVQPIAGNIERLFANPLVVRPIFELARRPQFIRAGLRFAYANSALITDDLVASYVAPTQDPGAGDTLCRLSQASTRYDYAPNASDRIRQLQCPALMLWGQQDRVIPLKRGRQLAQQHPNLTLVEIPQAGHCAYEEQPDRIHQELLQWAARVSQRRP